MISCATLLQLLTSGKGDSNLSLSDMVRHKDYQAATVNEAGRRGGLSRARALSPERRREIARQSRVGRAAKQLSGLSRRELAHRFAERIKQRDPDLACWIDTALRAPRRIGLALLEQLNDQALVVAATVGDELMAELSARDGDRA